jgi:serine/threonine-protein kinase
MKVGDRLGRFELLRELGRGSHGVVFEATDVLLGERVAIKALQPWLAGDVTLRERFKRELVLTRRVSHPGVARLHDLHEENGILFISMQYVEGKSLSQILRAGLPSEERVIHILRGVCGALAAAHAEGVIHRDLKPANIMVTDVDKVIVLDFGIATATGVGQLTRPGEAMGSVPYVPPKI